MKSFLLLLIAASIAVTTAGCGQAPASGPPADPVAAAKKRMPAFRSKEELKGFFRKLAEEQRKEAERRRGATNASANTSAPQGTPGAEAPAQAQTDGTTASKSVAGKDESVTNVQTAGVDEGGIVKLHGDYLVVLRRGRLFTVRIGGGDLKPVSAVDAFGPDVDPRGSWYDEMLVSDDTVVVIGYSYERGGTEVGLFRIDGGGNLSYQSTYHLRSNDYYSSRNYASRLIGSKLIFYTPLYLSPGASDPLAGFPAVRRWHKGARPEEFKEITEPTRVYRAEGATGPAYGTALHTVTVCDIKGGELSCGATAVVGAPGRVFYVAADSVYVWTTQWYYYDRENRSPPILYRMPLDGSAPTALRVSGSPVDQFSFLESGDGNLNVLVRSEAVGDGMWGAEVAAGDVALMRVPLASFSDGSEAAPSRSYRSLPRPEGYTFQNRFVGDYLLYGTGSGWGPPERWTRPTLYAVRWAKGGEPSALKLEHGVDRIEVMGSGAVVVGTDGRDLYFTGVRLGAEPAVVDSYVREGASQGELRSHGFFYKPDGADSGMLGLPVRGPGRPGYEHLFSESASILFLRNEGLRLTELGDLEARAEGAVDDGCRASCVDWYGNARPLFARGRIFALLGYELVEGELNGGRIRELRRASFAPRRDITSRV